MPKVKTTNLKTEATNIEDIGYDINYTEHYEYLLDNTTLGKSENIANIVINEIMLCCQDSTRAYCFITKNYHKTLLELILCNNLEKSQTIATSIQYLVHILNLDGYINESYSFIEMISNLTYNFILEETNELKLLNHYIEAHFDGKKLIETYFDIVIHNLIRSTSHDRYNKLLDVLLTNQQTYNLLLNLMKYSIDKTLKNIQNIDITEYMNEFSFYLFCFSHELFNDYVQQIESCKIDAFTILRNLTSLFVLYPKTNCNDITDVLRLNLQYSHCKEEIKDSEVYFDSLLICLIEKSFEFDCFHEIVVIILAIWCEILIENKTNIILFSNWIFSNDLKTRFVVDKLHFDNGSKMVITQTSLDDDGHNKDLIYIIMELFNYLHRNSENNIEIAVGMLETDDSQLELPEMLFSIESALLSFVFLLIFHSNVDTMIILKEFALKTMPVIHCMIESLETFIRFGNVLHNMFENHKSINVNNMDHILNNVKELHSNMLTYLSEWKT